MPTPQACVEALLTKSRAFCLGPPYPPNEPYNSLCEMAPYIEICYAYSGGGGAVASTVLDHVTGGLCLLFMYRCIYAWITSTGPVVVVFGYFLMPRVFCVLITMIASGYLVIDICFKVSRGDRWGAGAEVGSVEWWILFWLGEGACFFFLGGGLA